jgi:hypothetical protein
MRTSPGATLSAIGLRLAVLGALVLAAVGLRAADLQGASNRGWRLDDLSGSTPYLAVAGGVGLLVVLAVIAWAMTGSRKGQLPGRRRRSTWATLLLLGAGALVVVLLPPRGPAGQLAGGRAAPVPLPKGRAAPAATSHSGAAVVLLLLAVVLLTVFLAARGRRAPEPAPEAAAGPELADGLAAAAAVLRERPADDPRERVVAAYAAFEQALAGRGLQRGAAGTPTALLQRAVDGGAPAGPAGALTRLFGAARFGAAPVSEADVDAAEVALRALLASGAGSSRSGAPQSGAARSGTAR